MAAERRIRFGVAAIGTASLLTIGALGGWAQQRAAQAAQAAQMSQAYQAAQSIGIPQSRSGSGPISPTPFDDPSNYVPDAAKKRRISDRQKRLASDSQRLVLLANRLKSEVADSGADAMTPEMLRQMDEIERLAKSVKEGMLN